MDSFLDRFFPDRPKLMRAPTTQEIKVTGFVGMEIESASGKICNQPVHDEEEDYAVPVWTALLPVHTALGEPVECLPQMEGVTKPAEISDWVAVNRLDDVMLTTYRKLYPEG